jgi:type I restriction enzyme, S subunit
MKQGWEIRKLKELGVTQTGTTPKTSEKENFGEHIPFIKPADVDFEGNGKLRYDNEGLSEIGLSKSRKIESNSIFMVCIGATIGKVGFSEMDATCNQQINTLTLGNGYHPKFFYYGMTTKEFQDKVLLEGKGAQATLPIINKSKWENLTLPFPKSLPEQQRIVSILDECFAAIDKAKANAEQNLKNAKELFESYLQGVFENGNWETKTLNQISENLDSKRIPITKSQRKSGDIPYYGASGIVDYVADCIFDEDLLCVSEDGANLLARTYPIAFSISGKTWVNNHAHVLRFQNIITQKFVEVYINSIRIDDFVSGMAQPKLNQAMLNKIPIPFPPLKEQQTIVRQLDALRAETQKLEELKKSILQKAFAGELRTEKAIIT